MNDFFILYIDRLKNGESETFSSDVAADFLDCSEKELVFENPVSIKGEAYVANEHLVIHLDVATTVKMPCSICNQMIEYPLSIKNFYHTQEMEKCFSSTYDFRKALREQLLIELPQYVECKGGCSSREEVKKYLKKDTSSTEEPPYFPFSVLDENNEIGENHGST